MSINDRQLAFLKGQGYTGSINDAYRAYLLAQLGVTTGSIDDLLYAYLKGRWGYSGNLNDMLFAHLRYLGYTGSLNDMLYAAWGAAGIAGVSFSGNLTTSILPEYAVGSKAPTYTRATTATITDHENVVRPALSGEARFQGARRVRNWIVGSSENLTNANYVKDAGGTGVAPIVTAAYADGPVTGMTASRLQFNRGAGTTSGDYSRIYMTTASAGGVQHSFWAKSNTSSSYILSCFANGANRLFTVTPNWQRFAFESPTGNSYWWIATYGNDASSTTADVLITGAQQENTFGQSNTAPGEYVSVGAAKLNELTYTQDFDNAAWTKTRSSVSANSTTAPDSTSTADTLTEDSTVTSTHLVNSASVTVVSGATYTTTVYAKPNGRNAFALAEGLGVTATAFFDVSTGVVGTVTGTGSPSATITSAGNGWYRCSLTWVASGTSARHAIYLTTGTSSGNETYTGNGTSGIYLWGAQIERASTAGTYFPVGNVYPFHGAGVDGVKYFNTTNGNSVSNNIVTEASGTAISSSTLLGYLSEGARTNLCLQSEVLGTTWAAPTGMVLAANNTTAPDGAATADKLTDDSATSGHYIEQTGLTFSTATTYTFSAFVKWASGTRNIFLQFYTNAGADQAYVILNSSGSVVTSAAVGSMASVSASVKSYPSGWYRVTVTGTTGGTAGAGAVRLGHGSGSSAPPPGYTGNGTDASYWWGAQLEAGSFASSYIPTTTASVTRNADVLTYPFSGNVSTTQGSAYSEIFALWNSGGANPQAIIKTGLTGQPGTRILTSPNTAADNIQIFDGTNNNLKAVSNFSTAQRKAASSWGAAGLFVTAAGATAATTAFDGDLGGAGLAIGCSTDGGEQFFGCIRNTRIYQTQLSASQLQAVTA